MTKEELKQYIDQNIYENVDGDISGDSLNEVLKAIVDDGGTQVEANPEGGGKPSILQRIKIDDEIYLAPIGPQGDPGAPGPANTLAIGTVTDGEQASASITGNAPSQTLNLVLPKGEKGDTGNDAVNPFKGWFDDISDLPDNPHVGDYAYIKDNSTTYVYRCTTEGEWPSTSTEEKEPSNATFASAQLLNNVKIDDTHLSNPIGGDETNNPTLVKAEDAMQLKAKLEGITANEEKVTLSENTNYFDGKYVKNDKTIQTSTAPTGGVPNGILVVNVSNVKKVRFLGFERNDTTTAGYGFSANPIDPTSTGVQLDYAWAFKGNADMARAVEINVDVPEGMNWFVCTIYKYGTPYTAVMTLNDFYCYLYRGNSVNEVIDESINDYIETDLSFSLNGNNSVAAYKDLVLKDGFEYKLIVDPSEFSLQNIQNGINVYSLYKIVANTSTLLFATFKGTDSIRDTYSFTAQKADCYRITIRSDVGTSINFRLVGHSPLIEDMPTEGSPNLITSGGVYNALVGIKSIMTQNFDIDYFVNQYPTNQSHVEIKTRYRFAVEIPSIPMQVKVSGIPNGYIGYIGGVGTIANAFDSTVSSIELGGWGNYDYELTNEQSKVVVIGFKIGEEGTAQFSDNDIDALKENVKVELYPWVAGSGDNATDIVSLNDERLTTRYLTNLKRPNISADGSYTWGLNPFTLLHFSDLHADAVNLKRIMQWKEHYSEFIDDVICTGDIIRNVYGDSYGFWDNAGAEGVLVSTGNHEYYNGESSAYYTQITPLQVYNKFFAPYKDNWGTVVFPENAETEGYNYYYKDYASQKIRLIVLDNMANMSATRNNVQATWLASVLEDARLNNLHVICAIHIGSTIVTPYDSTFFSLANNINNDSGANSGTFAEFYTLRDAVETFITNGGNFVCWIMGHRHKDAVELLTGYRQCCVHVPTAAGGDTQRNVDGHVWWIIPQGDDCSRADNTKSQDCFNIYSVDTEKGMLRLFRVGNDIDRYGRHKGMLVYDYFNRQVIYSN